MKKAILTISVISFLTIGEIHYLNNHISSANKANYFDFNINNLEALAETENDSEGLYCRCKKDSNDKSTVCVKGNKISVHARCGSAPCEHNIVLCR